VNCGVEWGESLDGAFKGVRRRREEEEEVGGRAVGAGEAAQGKSARASRAGRRAVACTATFLWLGARTRVRVAAPALLLFSDG
jgi:hypothetical protein